MKSSKNILLVRRLMLYLFGEKSSVKIMRGRITNPTIEDVASRIMRMMSRSHYFNEVASEDEIKEALSLDGWLIDPGETSAISFLVNDKNERMSHVRIYKKDMGVFYILTNYHQPKYGTVEQNERTRRILSKVAQAVLEVNEMNS